ncbi:MAG: hypothetical protein ACYTG7_20690 [Planctomycetota bacterium]|jgi:hypothetical protein
MHRAIIFSIAMIALFAAGDPAQGATYLVKPDGTGDFPVIQAAVDAAADGDEILLADGVFEGLGNNEIDFRGKAITVRSQSGNPWNCILRGQYTLGIPSTLFIFKNNEGRDSVIRDLMLWEGSTATIC